MIVHLHHSTIRKMELCVLKKFMDDEQCNYLPKNIMIYMILIHIFVVSQKMFFFNCVNISEEKLYLLE